MLSYWIRFLAVLIIALALCNQSGIIPAALAMSATTDCCCPAEADTPPESEDCCAQPECQCLSCLNLVLQEAPPALAVFHETGNNYQDTVSALSGGVYRTIDYPPEAV
jgi:hypothetical protein